MLRENAGLTARDLEDLKNFPQGAAEEGWKRLEGRQARPRRGRPCRCRPESSLPDVEKRQAELDPIGGKAADAQAACSTPRSSGGSARRTPSSPTPPSTPRGPRRWSPQGGTTPPAPDPDAAKALTPPRSTRATRPRRRTTPARPTTEPLPPRGSGGPEAALDPAVRRQAPATSPRTRPGAAESQENSDARAPRGRLELARSRSTRRPRHRTAQALRHGDEHSGRRYARIARGGPPRRRTRPRLPAILDRLRMHDPARCAQALAMAKRRVDPDAGGETATAPERVVLRRATTEPARTMVPTTDAGRFAAAPRSWPKLDLDHPHPAHEDAAAGSRGAAQGTPRRRARRLPARSSATTSSASPEVKVNAVAREDRLTYFHALTPTNPVRSGCTGFRASTRVIRAISRPTNFGGNRCR